METVTKPRVTPRVAPAIKVPSTRKERVLAWMIGEVRAGRLHRGGMVGQNGRCTLGMVQYSDIIN